MKHLRAIPRLLAFLVWSFLHYSACLVTVPLSWIAPGPHHVVKDAIGRSWASGIAAIVGLHVHVEGHPPRAPFILVANHLGYVDIVTLMAQAPAVFVSRADLANWPVLGLLARAANTIFVDRSRRRDVVRANALISDVLASGRGLIIFPEGTSSNGEEVLPFRSSLLEPAVRIRHPVSYATLGYRTPEGSPPASLAVCWWGDMTFFDHFYGLLQLPRIDAYLSFGDEPVQAPDRHELAQRLRHAVSRQLAPMTTAPEARWA